MMTPGAEWLSWLTYSISGLMAVVCFAVIARALYMPPEVRRGAACGACRHELVDTSTNRCPECGGLLTKVGITTPAMAIRLRGGLGWALLAWTAICAGGARYAFSYLQMLSWRTQATTVNSIMQHDRETDLAPVFRGRGFSGDDATRPEYRIDLSTSVLEDKSNGTALLKSIRLTLRNGGPTPGRASLAIDGEKQTFEVLDKSGKALVSKNLDLFAEDAVKDWYAAAGLDTADAGIQRGITDAFEIVRSAIDDPGAIDYNWPRDHANPRDLEDGSLTSGGGGGSSSSMPAPTSTTSALWGDRLVYISLGIALAVYLGGAGFIARRHRRLLA